MVNFLMVTNFSLQHVILIIIITTVVVMNVYNVQDINMCACGNI